MIEPRQAAAAEKPVPVGVVEYVLKKARGLKLRPQLVSHEPGGSTVVQFVHARPGSAAHKKADELFHEKVKRANREGMLPSNLGRHAIDYTFSVHATRPARLTFLRLSPKAASHLRARVHVPKELR